MSQNDEYESTRFKDRAALRDKIEWEGGIFEAVDYGIRVADMPEGDTELAEAWRKLEAAYAEAERLSGDVEKLLPEADDEVTP